MGTDIYLNWDKKTKKDDENQVTGFNIDSGAVGYLRASIGMTNENQLLRVVFPEEIWESNTEQGEVFDFKDELNHKKVADLGMAYLMMAYKGREMEMVKETKSMIEAVGKMLQQAEVDKVEVSGTQNFRYAVMWLESLFNFMELGRIKQEAGLNPTVYISW